MTSSTTNTLRIKFNALRVIFLKKPLHLYRKEKDLGEDGRGEGVEFVFQNKEA